jgi:ferredoxin
LVKWFGDAAPQLRIAADSRSADGDRAVRRRALLRRALRSLAPLPAPPPSFDEYAELDDPEEAAPPRPVPYQAVLASRRHRLPFRPGGPVGATGRMIGAACSGCLVCAELCPTGALEGDCSARHRAISFDPARCTNCTLCLKICPMGAVGAKALRGVAAACAGRILLYGRAEQHCTGCGRQFAATEGNSGLCAACETEMELDAEWLDLLKN